jgi:replication factor C subunit 2/4
MFQFKQRTPVGPKVDTQQFLPWIEKYRPKTMDDVACQEEVVATLKKSMETGNLPHLLFYGPPGTGKTSTILAIGKQLYGPELFKERVMELNASDERGIAVVRTKVKNFAQVTASAPSKDSKYPCPPYKLIILDEADAMTQDAQNALRRTMETYSKTTRFCLICNYVSRIIDPLTSRCAKFRFKALNSESMMDRIKYICKEEDINFTPQLGEVLAEVSNGDLRKAITFLQSAHSLYGKQTTVDAITEIAGNVPNKTIEGLVKAATSNSFDQLQKAVTSLIASGYPAAQVLSQLFDQVASSKILDNVQKANISEVIAQADKCLQDGADEFLQLMSVLSSYMKQTCL